MKLKDLFEQAENNTLTLEQFNKLVEENELNFVDLSEGNYVSKQKFENELQAKTEQVESLSTSIAERDKNLEQLQGKLKGVVDATQFESVSSEFNALKEKYEADTKAYQEKLSKQAYEFAVKEYASGKEFSSKAASRDFINSMLAKELQLDDGKILGADEFTDSYAKENSDAFVVKKSVEPTKPAPKFAGPTDKTPSPKDEKTSGFNFNFVGVRPKE